MRDAILIVFMFLLALSTPTMAADTVQSLEQELIKLESELPYMLNEETELKTREDYIDRVLVLRAKIKELEEPEGGHPSAGDQRHIFKLVRIESSEELGETAMGDTSWRKSFDEQSTTYTYVRDATKSKLHPKQMDTSTIGFDEYPHEIIMGNIFSFRASAVTQRDLEAGRCKGQRQNLPLSMTFAANGHFRLFTHYVRKSTPFEVPGCTGSSGGAAVGVGARVEALFECHPKRGAYENGSILYNYDCTIKATDGEGLENAKRQDMVEQKIVFALDVKKDSDGKSIEDENGLYLLEAPSAKHDPIQKDFSVRLSMNNSSTSYPVSLVYEPVYSLATKLNSTETVQHVAINNHTDGVGLEAPQNENTLHALPADFSETLADPKKRQPHIEYWLTNADPKDNVDPNYNLKYDKWGRVHGTVPNGTITTAGKPDDATGWWPDPYEYVWSKSRALDSWNLCTLREYVERKLGELETESCKIDRPLPPKGTKTPNFVGMEAAAAKVTLDKLGIKTKWQTGSIAKNTAQQSLVEKQNPPAGKSLDGVDEVELWVYQMATKTAKVPNVRGKPYEEAVKALEKAGFKHKKQALEGAPRAEAANTVKDIRTLDDYPVSDIEPMNVGTTFWLIVYGDHKPGDASSSPSNFVSSTWSTNPTPNPTPKPKPKPKEQVKPNTGFSFGSLNTKTDPAKTTDTAGDFKCETGMGHIPVEKSGKLYPDRKNGVLETDELGMKNYICRYNMKGRSRVAQIVFFDKAPSGGSASDMKNRLCGPNAMYKNLNRGKALTVYLATGAYFTNIGSDAEIDRFINFHVDQIASKAIPCGGVVPLEKAEPPKKDPPKTSGTPSQFKCNAGFGLSVDSAASQNGVVKTGPSGEKKYECRYNVQGKQRTVRVEFFDTPQPVSKSYLKNQFCRNFKYSYPPLTQSIAVQMVGANITSAVGEKNVIPFYKFHVDQVSPYAIPCNDKAGQPSSSGGGSPKPKGNYYYKQ